MFFNAIEELDLKLRIDVWEMLAVFLLYKYSRCIYSTIYQQIKCSMLFMIRKKRSNQSLNTSSASITLYAWRPFAAISKLRCVRCEGEFLKHFARQRWMWRVFMSTVRCRRDSGLQLWLFSTLIPDNAKVGLKKYGDGIISVIIEPLFFMYVLGSGYVFKSHGKRVNCIDSTSLFLFHAIYQW